MRGRGEFYISHFTTLLLLHRAEMSLHLAVALSCCKGLFTNLDCVKYAMHLPYGLGYSLLPLGISSSPSTPLKPGVLLDFHKRTC